MKFFALYLLSSWLLLFLVSCSGDGSNSSKAILDFAITRAPSITLANQDAYMIEGICTEKGGTVTVSVASLNPRTATCSEELKWQVTVDISPINAVDSVLIAAAEESGKSVTQEVERDTTRPEVAIGSGNPPVNSINQGSYDLRGTCDEEDGEVVLDVGGISATADCDGANWVANALDLSELAADVDQVPVTVDLADALGNPARQASANLARDIIPPLVGITSPPGINRNSIDSYALEGSCEYNGPGVVTVSMTGLLAREVDCESGGWRLELAASELQGLPEQNGIAILVEHRDAAENVGRDETGRVNKDTMAPVLAITSGLTINAANQATYALAGTCSEAGGNVGIKIGSDAINTAVCDSNRQWTFTPGGDLSEQSYALAITQEDAAGNTGTITPVPTLVKDVTAPAYAFDSNLDINAANENQYHVSGTCNEEGQITVTVGDLGEKAATCQGSTWRTAAFNTASISTGTSVTLSAVARDSSGNQQTGLSKTVGKDTTSQSVQIALPAGSHMAAPINAANAASYPVSGTCSSHDGAVTVTVGTSPTTVSSTSGADECSSDGQWSLTVNVPESIFDGEAIAIVASFGSGDDLDTDATTALKDTVVPVLAMTPPPISSLNQESYSFSGTCTGGHGQVSITVGTINIQVDCVGDAWSVDGLDVASLTGSSVTITADGVDAAGNPAVQQSAIVDRDVVAPDVAIVSADDITVTNKDSYSISGTCGEDGEDNVEVAIADGPSGTVSCASRSWTFSPTTADIPEGSHIAVTVQHRDTLGNLKTIGDEINKDTRAPEVTITSDLMVNAEEIAVPYVLGGTCTEGDGEVRVEVAGYPDLDIPCTGGFWERSLNLSTGDEIIALTISQTDASGNTHEITPSIDKDTTPPTIRITALPDINIANNDNYIVSGICEGKGYGAPNQPITLTLAGNIVIRDLVYLYCLNIWDFFDVRLAAKYFHSLPDGEGITLVASASDHHGNLATSPVATFDKDTTAPQVTITTPLAAITEGNVNSYPLSGTCTFGDAPLTVRVGTTASEGPVDCESEGTWSTTVDISPLGKGTFDVTASQTDALGNRGDDSGSVIKSFSNVHTFLLETVSLGGFHSCALKANGQVACWGNGAGGQLGNGSRSDQSYPVTVQDSSNVAIGDIVQISAGNYHSCALKSDGGVLCWGRGDQGQLGDNGTTLRNNPVTVVGEDGDNDDRGDGSLSGIVQISSGASNTCALKSDGGVLCWGTNATGQLGNGESGSGQKKSYPVKVQESNGTALSGIVQIDAGNGHTCATTSGGEAFCWGNGEFGSLGNGDETRRVFATSVKVNSSTKLSGVVQVGSGSAHSCALKSNGEVWCWGSGDSMQVRSGDAVNSEGAGNLYAIATTFDDTTLLGGVRQMGVGTVHTCARTSGMELKVLGGIKTTGKRGG